MLRDADGTNTTMVDDRLVMLHEIAPKSVTVKVRPFFSAYHRSTDGTPGVWVELAVEELLGDAVTSETEPHATAGTLAWRLLVHRAAATGGVTTLANDARHEDAHGEAAEVVEVAAHLVEALGRGGVKPHGRQCDLVTGDGLVPRVRPDGRRDDTLGREVELWREQAERRHPLVQRPLPLLHDLGDVVADLVDLREQALESVYAPWLTDARSWMARQAADTGMLCLSSVPRSCTACPCAEKSVASSCLVVGLPPPTCVAALLATVAPTMLLASPPSTAPPASLPAPLPAMGAAVPSHVLIATPPAAAAAASLKAGSRQKSGGRTETFMVVRVLLRRPCGAARQAPRPVNV
jgi:hypothetical protein